MLIEGEGGSGKSTLVAGAARRRPGAAASTSSTAARGSCRRRCPYESLVAAVSRYLRSRPADEVARLDQRSAHAGCADRVARSATAGRPPPRRSRCARRMRSPRSSPGSAPSNRSCSRSTISTGPTRPASRCSSTCASTCRTPRCCCVLTSRPDEADRRPEVRQLLATLRRAPWSSTIRLGRLDRPAIDAVVAERLGGSVTPRVYEIVAARSGGTPLLIHELLDDLVERGVIVQHGEVWELCGDDMPVGEVGDRPHPVAPRPGGGARPRGARGTRRRQRPDRPTRRRRAARRSTLDAVEAIARPVARHPPGDRDRPARRPSGQPVARAGRSSIRSSPRWWRRNSSTPPAVGCTARLLEVDAEAPLGRRARHALIAGEPTDRLATIALLADAGSEALARATPSAAIEPLQRCAVAAARR